MECGVWGVVTGGDLPGEFPTDGIFSIAATIGNRTGLTLNLRKAGLISTLRKAGLTHTLRKAGMTPTLRKAGLTPTLKKAGLTPTLRKADMTHTPRKAGLTTRDGKSLQNSTRKTLSLKNLNTK